LRNHFPQKNPTFVSRELFARASLVQVLLRKGALSQSRSAINPERLFHVIERLSATFDAAVSSGLIQKTAERQTFHKLLTLSI